MGELEQFDEIIEGFKNIIKKIKALENQAEEDFIKEEIEMLKKISKQQVILINHVKKNIEETGIEEIKTIFGEDKIKQDLKNCSAFLEFIESELLFIEAHIKGNFKIVH